MFYEGGRAGGLFDLPGSQERENEHALSIMGCNISLPQVVMVTHAMIFVLC